MKRLVRFAVIGLLAVGTGAVGFLIGRALPASVPVAKVNLSGVHSAAINVRRPDGSPATGEPWSLRYLADRNVSAMGVTYGNPPKSRQIKPAGASLDLTLAMGVVPDNGIVELRGLRGGEDAQFLHLFVGQNGHLSFAVPDETKLHEDLAMELPVELQPGSTAPVIQVLRVANGAATSLPTEGKVTYLEFWGVNCGPCQKPLAELDALAKGRPEWKDKVQLASICLDPIEDVRRHVDKRGLVNLDHFIPATDGHPASGQPNAYGVQGVPVAFLIDETGQVVWSGHPEGFDVEGTIDSVLKGSPKKRCRTLGSPEKSP